MALGRFGVVLSFVLALATVACSGSDSTGGGGGSDEEPGSSSGGSSSGGRRGSSSGGSSSGGSSSGGSSSGGSSSGGSSSGSAQTCESPWGCINGVCKCSGGPKKGQSCCDPDDGECSATNDCNKKCEYCQ